MRSHNRAERAHVAIVAEFHNITILLDSPRDQQSLFFGFRFIQPTQLLGVPFFQWEGEGGKFQ